MSRSSAAAARGRLPEGLAEAVTVLRELYPCSEADAEAMVRLIDADKAVANWPRYLRSFTPEHFASWQARSAPTPIPPPLHVVLAAQPRSEPSGDVVPVDRSLAELRERMGWTAPSAS